MKHLQGYVNAIEIYQSWKVKNAQFQFRYGNKIQFLFWSDSGKNGTGQEESRTLMLDTFVTDEEKLRNYKYYEQLDCCYYPNVSVALFSSLHQVLVKPGNIQGIPNRTLYLSYGYRLFLFSCTYLGIFHLYTA